MNKIPCLDKGYVAYISSSNNTRSLTELALEFFRTTDTTNMQHMGNLTIAVKCPLFVQLNLSKFNLDMLTTAQFGEPEAYVPNPGEIGGPDRETNTIIADDLGRTSEALLINPRAYQTDGADRFVSQILTPVSTYTTLILHGTYSEFRRFVNQPNMPAPIKSYALAVQQILDMEWR